MICGRMDTFRGDCLGHVILDHLKFVDAVNQKAVVEGNAVVALQFALNK